MARGEAGKEPAERPAWTWRGGSPPGRAGAGAGNGGRGGREAGRPPASGRESAAAVTAAPGRAAAPALLGMCGGGRAAPRPARGGKGRRRRRRQRADRPTDRLRGRPAARPPPGRPERLGRGWARGSGGRGRRGRAQRPAGRAVVATGGRGCLGGDEADGSLPKGRGWKGSLSCPRGFPARWNRGGAAARAESRGHGPVWARPPPPRASLRPPPLGVRFLQMPSWVRSLNIVQGYLACDVV